MADEATSPKPDAAKPDAPTEPKGETKAGANTDAKSEARPATKAEAKPETKGDVKAEGKAGPKVGPKTDGKASGKPRAPKTSGPPKSAKSSPPKLKVASTKPAPVHATKAPPKVPHGTVVDASGLVLGRAASLIAKRLLRGESIVVVNADKSVVTGSRTAVLNFYIANRARGSVRSGPHFPRYPDRIFRRTVRGMLPHLKTRGKEAFDRLEVYIGCPADLTGVNRQSLEGAKAPPALRPPLTLGEISILLGARL